MSGIFLSHSAIDKRFVRRLALDLLQRDLPVWFDEWELIVGAKLSDHINSAIFDSPFFLLVLSRSAVQSTWVDKEVAWALDRETETGREILLPIRIDDCDIPARLTDRLCADFSVGYLTALESLVKTLRQRGIDRHEAVAPDQELIPLCFSHGTRLNRVQLQQRLEKLLARLPEDYLVTADQFRLSTDDHYDELRRRLFNRMENLAADPFYSTEFENRLSNIYQFIIRSEEELLDGLARIINKMRRMEYGYYALAVACHWYARMTRSEVLGRMYECQRPDLDTIEYGKDCFENYCARQTNLAWLHEVAETVKIDIGPSRDGLNLDWGFGVVVDGNSSLASEVREEYPVPVRLMAHMSMSEIAEWIVPYLVTYQPEIDDWDFARYFAAPH